MVGEYGHNEILFLINSKDCRFSAQSRSSPEDLHFVSLRQSDLRFTPLTVFLCTLRFNSLPNDNFLDWSKLKAFADDKNKYKLKKEILLGMGRKHCGKMRKRKCWLPALSPFPTMFSNGFFFGVVESQGCVVKVKLCITVSYYYKFIYMYIYVRKHINSDL